jgi:hypothetical protein
MIRGVKIYSLIFFTLILSSCFKEDEKIDAPVMGEVEIAKVSVGSNYDQQAYFNIRNNEVVASVPYDNWDLAFSCKEDDWTIRLNTSKMMYAAQTEASFEEDINTDDLEFRFDPSSGNQDSTAMAAWFELKDGQAESTDYTWVIDRGINTQGESYGTKKLKVEVLNNRYQISYAELDNFTSVQSADISKWEDYHFNYFSFEKGAIPSEPQKSMWTMRFQRYTTLLFTSDGEEYPYVVVGPLLNPDVRAARVQGDFDEFTLADTNSVNLSSQQDIISWDWKIYDFETGTYTIVPDLFYIIKDQDGFFYKLRFTDFYDEGIKGNISMETVRL